MRRPLPFVILVAVALPLATDCLGHSIPPTRRSPPPPSELRSGRTGRDDDPPSLAPAVASFVSRRALLSALTPLPLLLCAARSARAGIDVSGLRVEDGSSKKSLELAGVTYTPAAMVLQMAEQTASMEGMMNASAKETQTKTRAQRFESGSKGEGPGVVARTDLVKSVDVMANNSKIAMIAPAAAVTLAGVKRISNEGTGDMTYEEYSAVAKQYGFAREDLRRAFESFSVEEQAEGKTIVRRLRAKDEERMRGGERIE